MASRVKVIRRLGTPLPGLTRKLADRRPYPPGTHGARARLRESDYRRQLEEKQKARFHYGVSETQLRRYLGKAAGEDVQSGGTRLVLLERRLDNAVFRLGWAPTISAARQLVVHGHVRVNGRRVDRPSYLVKIGDEIELSSRRGAWAASSPRSEADRKWSCRVICSGSRTLGEGGSSDCRRAAIFPSKSMKAPSSSSTPASQGCATTTAR
jgi:ribosomal protein S4